MKRMLSFGMCIIALVLMVSCSSSSATPGAALKGYVEELKAGNYEKFVEGIAFKDDLAAEGATQMFHDGTPFSLRLVLEIGNEIR